MSTDELTTDGMRYVVAKHYFGFDKIPGGWPNHTASMELLREVGVRCGWHVQIQISGAAEPGMDLYCVYVRTTGGTPECGGYHQSSSFSIAAVHCAYAAIPYDNSQKEQATT